MTGYGNQPISQQAAKELLALPLEDKVVLSREKIEQWYDAWGGKCYVSFSGGKDSTVLAYLAAKELSRYRTPIYPLTLVFVNTGLEYPEIQHFANDYVAWLQRQFTRIDVQLVRLRPKMNIRQVLTKYGYPVIGKKQARFIRDLQNAHGQNDATVNLYLTGYNREGVYCSTMKLADKWHYKQIAIHGGEQNDSGLILAAKTYRKQGNVRYVNLDSEYIVAEIGGAKEVFRAERRRI